MKNSKSKKDLNGLVTQKVNSDKIHGGGARPEPLPLTKLELSNVDPVGGTSNDNTNPNPLFPVESETKKRGIKRR